MFRNGHPNRKLRVTRSAHFSRLFLCTLLRPLHPSCKCTGQRHCLRIYCDLRAAILPLRLMLSSVSLMSLAQWLRQSFRVHLVSWLHHWLISKKQIPKEAQDNPHKINYNMHISIFTHDLCLQTKWSHQLEFWPNENHFVNWLHNHSQPSKGLTSWNELWWCMPYCSPISDEG